MLKEFLCYCAHSGNKFSPWLLCTLHWHAADCIAWAFHLNRDWQIKLSKTCCLDRLLKILNKMSMSVCLLYDVNVWIGPVCIFMWMCQEQEQGWRQDCMSAVRVWLALLVYVVHSHSLQPPFSVLVVPPETECVRLLSECVSVCWCVCLACCVPPLLVLGDWKLYFYNTACFRRFGGIGCLAEMLKNALCWYLNILMAQLVVMATRTSLPPFCIPIDSHPVVNPFLKSINPLYKHVVPCASSAPAVSITQESIFVCCRNKMLPGWFEKC